jgi:hypothetical protein
MVRLGNLLVDRDWNGLLDALVGAGVRLAVARKLEPVGDCVTLQVFLI